ncbi:MAG: hypothetical protein NVS4B1_16620 [Ktedonobacteraceae bacterium]
MRNMKRKREFFPPWKMPSDPVKAVWWFLHWLLKVLVRFFWLPVVGMVLYETYLSAKVSGITNGIVAGIITLLVGLAVWGALYAVLFALKVSTSISQTISDVSRMQRTFSTRRSPFYTFPETEQEEPNVVEGTITDLEEERKKRRKE